MNELESMLETALLHFGIDKQIDKTIEELDELKQALIEYKADKNNKDKIKHVKEESCDVANMVAQMDKHLSYKVFDKVLDMKDKMTRTILRIEAGWVKYK